MGDAGFTVVPVVIAVGFVVVGAMQVVVGGAGVRRALQTRRVLQRALPVRATVVGVRQERRRRSEGIDRYDEWTTVRYAHPRTEAVHEVEVPVPDGLRGRRPGDEVDVVVDPQDPSMVLPPRVPSRVVLVISALFVVIGLVVIAGVGVVAVGALTSDDVEVPIPEDQPFPAP